MLVNVRYLSIIVKHSGKKFQFKNEYFKINL
jgi:hypothetical protein